MSTEFKSLIRPFQDRSTTPAQTYYAPGQIGVPNVILNIGRNANGKTMQGNYSKTETRYMEAAKVEKIYIGPDGQQGSSP